MEAERVDLVLMAAMRSELAVVTERYPALSSRSAGDDEWVLREGPKGTRFRTVICGVKAGRAAALLDDLSQMPNAGHVLIAGCCGALDPSLPLGILIVASGFIDVADGSAYPVNRLWQRRLETLFPEAGTGRFATVAEAVLTREAKRECRRRTGAVAVEMEDAVIAREAQKRGFSVNSIRWVLDSALEDVRVEHGAPPSGESAHQPAGELSLRLGNLSKRIESAITRFLADIAG